MEPSAPSTRSKVELIKEASRYLRGTLKETLASDATHFSEDEKQLLKFHGTYQQDDRDLRKQLQQQGKEPHYMFMVRVRMPGGALTAQQYLACDELASKYANGTLRLTTRQGIQFHGVLKRGLKATIAGINQALLTTLSACGDVSRNVMGCPAPAAGQRSAQVVECARQLADHLSPRTKAYHEIWLDGERVGSAAEREPVEPIYGKVYLPRKFKIGIAMPEDNCVDVYSQDIGLVALLRGETLEGFNVLIGGGMGMTHGDKETFPRLADPMAFVTPDQLVSVAETIVTVQRDHGDRKDRKHARMKYLVQEWGVTKFRAEVERRLGRRLADLRPMAPLGMDYHLGWHPQGDGRWFLGLSIENGRIKDAGALRLRSGLRTVVERFRMPLRVTPMQDLLLTDVTEAQRSEIEAMLTSYGIPLLQTIANVQRYAMACPALPTCGLALTDSERALPPLIDRLEVELRRLGLEREVFSIRMTGCPNGCARPYLGDLGFVGRTPGTYNIYVGGDFGGNRLNELFRERVPQEQLVTSVLPLFLWFKEARQPGEMFGDFCHRQGVAALRTYADTHPVSSA